MVQTHKTKYSLLFDYCQIWRNNTFRPFVIILLLNSQSIEKNILYTGDVTDGACCKALAQSSGQAKKGMKVKKTLPYNRRTVDRNQIACVRIQDSSTACYARVFIHVKRTTDIGTRFYSTSIHVLQHHSFQNLFLFRRHVCST